MVGDRRDDDAGAIAWPGFVDILSAVIMMFVFFVMITSIVMYVLSVEYKKSLSKQNEERVSKMVTEQLSGYVEKIQSGEVSIEDVKNTMKFKEKVQTLQNENQQLTKDKRELTHDMEILSGAIEQIKADFAENLKQSTTLSDGFFVILFEHNDISVSKETTSAIQAYVENRIKQAGTKDVRVSILAPDNPNAPTISVSRELSLARALNIRNVVMDKGVTPADISVRYIDAQAIDESFNWVKIGVEKK